MLGLKKFLFKGGDVAGLPDDVRADLENWRAQEATSLSDLHFHVRYVIVDVVTTGMNPETDKLLGISAVSVRQNSILPGDAFCIDLDDANEDPEQIARKLMAFLRYVGKSPMACYHVPFVASFLERAYKERLGLDFNLPWVDLAWLLPSMFEDKAHSVMPLDHWVEAFSLDGGSGRRDSMANSLLLARIFQMLLVKATAKEIDTAEQLIKESRASNFLRRGF